MLGERHGADTVRAALACVDPNVERKEWAKVAFAIKSELGEEGFPIFDEWSQGGQKYREKDTRSAWRSAKAGGRVTIGTLFSMAAAGGFRLDDHVPKRASAKPGREELARRKTERLKAEAVERKREAERHQAAAVKARARWDAASEAGSSPYLQRKGVRAHGCRFEADGVLLVPLRDAAGEMWNLQAILPAPRADGADKPFLGGARVTGCMHWLGAPAGAAWLLVAEGYATGASLHEASGLPVAVAFNAGNLEAVVRAIRKRYPDARILVCADDDSQTKARTGRNPGVEAAEAAARKVKGARWVKPAGLADGATDFNDLASSAGLEEVARQVRAVIGASAGRAAAPAKGEPEAPGAERQDRPPGRAAGVGEGEPPADAGARAGGPDSRLGGSSGDGRFSLRDDGVFFDGGKTDNSGAPLPPARVCGPLEVLAESRDADSKGWGLLLRITDRDGQSREWLAPGALLAGDGVELRKALRERGLWIATTKGLRELLIQYLESRFVKARVRTVPVVGWSEDQYALPSTTIAPPDATERVVFSALGEVGSQFRQAGSVQEWREKVSALCIGNSRLMMAVSAAFAAPLLGLAEEPSGGFHFRGDSSTGKTSALRVAASVFGGPGYMLKWRSTDNALEAIAAQYSDAPLILDELGMLEARAAGDVAYMLAEGMSKSRLHRTATLKDRQTWRVLVLSSGEVGFGELAQEAGKRLQADQEVRFAEIPADAGVGFGAFENLHDYAAPGVFAEHLGGQTRKFYGAVGMAWVRWLVEHREKAAGAAQRRVRELARAWVPEESAGQVSRVARRFALAAVGGELASHCGLTGWDKGAAEAAAEKCFRAWVAARGGVGRSEERDMMRAVRSFLELHGEGRFQWWHRAADDRAPKALSRAGFRKLVHGDREVESTVGFESVYGGEHMTSQQAEESHAVYYVLAEVFRKEVCAGYDARAVAKLLARHGHLVTDEKDERLAKKVRLPLIGPTRCYVVKPSVFELES